MGSLLQNFVISFFTLPYVPLDEQIPFYRKQFSPEFYRVTGLRIFSSKWFIYALNTYALNIYAFMTRQGINYAIN